MILFMLLLSVTSCVTIIKWRYGITNPKEQTPQKLASFLKKHRFPDSCQYLFNDSTSYFQGFRNPVFRKNMFSNMVFDARGTLLIRDTNQCQWSGFELIKSLNVDSAYLNLPGLQLSEILDHIHPVEVQPELNSLHQQPDFTVLITWAKFLGTYNSRLFELSDAVRQNKTARIRLIFLNVDMLESWNLTKDQKMQIK